MKTTGATFDAVEIRKTCFVNVIVVFVARFSNKIKY